MEIELWFTHRASLLFMRLDKSADRLELLNTGFGVIDALLHGIDDGIHALLQGLALLLLAPGQTLTSWRFLTTSLEG